MNRRKFLETGVVGSISLAVLQNFTCRGDFPRRTLGRTGESLSIIGFGGIIVRDLAQSEADRIVARAFDIGINYYDVAPSYGNAEAQLGPALQPLRKQCFLACKTTERKRSGAERELNESLQKLRTDYFDLYQLHALTTREDVETAFGPDGAMEACLKARQQGKIRYLGFSAHSVEAALLAMDRFDFDTVLFPINFVCWFQGNFGPQVVARAKAANRGILALKGLALTHLAKGAKLTYPKCWYQPIEDDETADLSLRFTLSQGTTAAVTPGEAAFLDKALRIASSYQPLSEAELARLKTIASGLEPLFKS